MESPTMRESMREGSKASSKSMGYMSVAEEAGESILSDIQAVLVGNAELRKELQEVSEQVGRVHESIQHLVLAQNGGGGKRRGSRFSTAGRLSRGNSFESIESRNAARSPRPSIANFQGGDGAVVVANREEGKLLRHARTMRVNKRARVGMAAASLPIGWPVCIEALEKEEGKPETRRVVSSVLADSKQYGCSEPEFPPVLWAKIQKALRYRAAQ
mmetsp:Transcript_292/g.529  ORF Transcript_292/g.529 Transcript_292/m.529 type:complete len:215 (+) Transcript_292:109-753(+)